MLIVVPAILALLGDRRNGEARVHKIELFFEPLEVAVSSLNFEMQRLHQNIIGDVWFFEEAALLLIILQYFDFQLFIEELRHYLLPEAFDSVKVLALCFLLFFYYHFLRTLYRHLLLLCFLLSLTRLVYLFRFRIAGFELLDNIGKSLEAP